MREAAFRDLERFVENWQIAYSVLCLLDDSAHAGWNRSKASAPAAVAAPVMAPADARRRARELWTVGVNAAQAKQAEQALESFKQALALDPGMGQAHRSIANLLTKLGRSSDAIGHFRSYLSLSPDAEDRKEVSRMIEDWESNQGPRRGYR